MWKFDAAGSMNHHQVTAQLWASALANRHPLNVSTSTQKKITLLRVIPTMASNPNIQEQLWCNGDILIMAGKFQAEYLHGVPQRSEWRTQHLLFWNFGRRQVCNGKWVFTRLGMVQSSIWDTAALRGGIMDTGQDVWCTEVRSHCRQQRLQVKQLVGLHQCCPSRAGYRQWRCWVAFFLNFFLTFYLWHLIWHIQTYTDILG